MSFFKELFLDPFEENKEKPVDTRKSEHLKEGVSPIIACVGTPEQFEENPGGEEEIASDSPSEERDNKSRRDVDYYGDPGKLRKDNFKNAGHNSYVVSPIDSENKLSRSFLNCTGVVATGIDKSTGKNISFVSHQDPGYFLRNSDGADKFVGDLRERLEDLSKMSEEGTVDAVIVGGNYFKSGGDWDKSFNTRSYRENYLASIELISDEIFHILGFQPVVITGPKTTDKSEDIFYDNDHRRLYIMRPEVGDETTKSYISGEVKNQEKNW